MGAEGQARMSSETLTKRKREGEREEIKQGPMTGNKWYE